MSALSVSYSNFLILITLLFLGNDSLNEGLIVLVSLLIIFSANLVIGINLAKNLNQITGNH